MNKITLFLILIAQAGLWGCASLNYARMPADEQDKRITRPPHSPDRTWITPTRRSKTPGNQIKPAAGDRSWNTKKPPVEPDKGWTVPATDAPATDAAPATGSVSTTGTPSGGTQ